MTAITKTTGRKSKLLLVCGYVYLIMLPSWIYFTFYIYFLAHFILILSEEVYYFEKIY